jgi:hypothetical protein
MCDQKEARIVLWGRHQAELLHAQNLDAEAERLETRAKSIREDAAECRRRARYIKQAAETIGHLNEEIA